MITLHAGLSISQSSLLSPGETASLGEQNSVFWICRYWNLEVLPWFSRVGSQCPPGTCVGWGHVTGFAHWNMSRSDLLQLKVAKNKCECPCFLPSAGLEAKMAAFEMDASFASHQGRSQQSVLTCSELRPECEIGLPGVQGAALLRAPPWPLAQSPLQSPLPLRCGSRS